MFDHLPEKMRYLNENPFLNCLLTFTTITDNDLKWLKFLAAKTIIACNQSDARIQLFLLD